VVKEIAVQSFEMIEKDLSYKLCSQSNYTTYFIPFHQVQGIIKDGVLKTPDEMRSEAGNVESKPEKYFKNSFHANVGFIPSTSYYSIAANYEKLIRSKKANKQIKKLFRFGFGVLPDHFFARYKGDNTPFLIGQIGMFTGKLNHHFEAAAGIIIVFNPYVLLFPLTANIGYRYQMPQKPWIIRTGVSWPEGIYAGVGYSFD
jgi:hypothetical protein